eukprot:gene6017-12130_t
MSDTVNFMKLTFNAVKVHREPVLPCVGRNFDFSSAGQMMISVEGYIPGLLKPYPDCPNFSLRLSRTLSNSVLLVSCCKGWL